MMVCPKCEFLVGYLNGVVLAPSPLAGEGWGEGGMRQYI